MLPPEAESEPTWIVLVDDDVLGLNLLDHLVRDLTGSQVMCFFDPVLALAWCRAQRPDIVITDYQMPRLNGIELIRELRGGEHTRDVPIMVITAATEREVRYEALEAGANDYLSKPIDAAEVGARVKNMLAIRKGQRSLRERAGWLAQEVARATEKISAREQEVIVRLSRAAEYRDWETGAHIVRVAWYSRIIAQRLGRPEHEQEAIFKAAPMHDVGKIGVPDYILLKPGRLDDAEFAIMKQHTLIGHRILSGSTSELLQHAAEIALNHHERYDGAGYPSGRKGEAIPLAGRIVAVADVFDALLSDRPYKRPWQLEAALACLRENTGGQFDPACIMAFMDGIDAILEARAAFTDGGSATEREPEGLAPADHPQQALRAP